MEDSDEEEAKEVVSDILSGASPQPQINKRTTLLKLSKANQENEVYNSN